jgi:hypothetical protein
MKTKLNRVALQMVAEGRGASVNLNSLRALSARGLITLRVKTTRFPRRGRTIAEIEVEANITPAGRAAL